MTGALDTQRLYLFFVLFLVVARVVVFELFFDSIDGLEHSNHSRVVFHVRDTILLESDRSDEDNRDR